MSGYSSRLEWGAATSTGVTHLANEDAHVTAPPVFAVADGMGGHVGGARASAITAHALSALRGYVCGTSDVVEIISHVNDAIVSDSQVHPELTGMGTTLSGLALVEEDDRELWLLFNIGDSRIYHAVDDTITQLTVDHSLVQELIDSGELTTEEAAEDPRRNVVTRALGSDPAPEVDFWVLAPQPGERFLVCSDGVAGWVTPVEMLKALTVDDEPSTVARMLVDRAIEAGSRDDATAVVVRARIGDVVVRPQDEKTRERRREADEDTVPRVPTEGEGASDG